MIGRRIQYFGTVQGVGFRRRTERLAAGWAVTGYVRNLDDGSVELVVEGADAEVRLFLAQVRERLSAEIERVQETDVPVAGYKDFTIRR